MNLQNNLRNDYEARNKGLEMIFGADFCHNADRIGRLPGTINYPDAGKIKKGRKSSRAKVVFFRRENIYPSSAFKPYVAYSPPVAAAAMPILTPASPLASLDDLKEYAVPERIKEIVQHGHSPEEQKTSGKDISASGWMFDGVCGLVRARVPNEVILSLLLDPRFGISAHILKQGRRTEEYARRQIQRAIQTIETNKRVGWSPASEDGQPRPSYHNARVAIIRLGLRCEHDLFHNRYKIFGNSLQHHQGEATDTVCSVVRQLIHDEFGFDPGKEHVRDAINQLCLENPCDPVCDYLDGLVWDGTPRLEHFFSRYLGADDTALNRTVSRLALIAAVRRAREPGCKYDLVIVLEGKQGTGKSTVLRFLAGDENFSDQEILALGTKEQMEAIEGVWLFEISEMMGLKKSDLDRLKAFISRTTDRARPAYGRSRIDSPRRCVFIGTTNEDQYLRDITGNRRFFPVRTGTIDLQAVIRDRDQLWAEAAHAEAQGESITLPSELWEAAARVQETRVEHDLWIDYLADLEGDKISSVALMKRLDMAKDKWSPALYKRLGYVMRVLGWEGPKGIRIDGRVTKGFVRLSTPKQANLLDE